MRKFMAWMLIVAQIVMVGCTPIKTKTPLSSCPLPQKTATFDNGTIFQPNAIRPLFEDRRARNVGDELTITIGESTAPTQKSSANASKTETPDVSLPSNSKDVKSTSPKGSGGSAYSGSIVATVIVVLDNGKLLVCGDKLVKYANADLNFEYIRITGIVSPGAISPTNTVQSSQLADVQIEYRNADNLGPAGPQPTFSSRFSRLFAPKKMYY